MSVSYRNPPLVELVVELRWGGPPLDPATGAPPVGVKMPQTQDEVLFMQFGALMSAENYGRFERLVPAGFPMIWGQVAVRCRPTNPDQSSPLFQIGPGVFSANALPPYKSWVDFQPLVRKGAETLFEAHKRAGRDLPKISAAFVRYIDVFRDHLTGGRDIPTFLREIMGIDILLPKTITSMASDPNDIKCAVQLALPTAVGQVNVSFGEVRQSNERGILMDTHILVQRDIGPNVDAAVDALTEGRQVIHDLFRGLTAPLHQTMGPVQ